MSNKYIPYHYMCYFYILTVLDYFWWLIYKGSNSYKV